MRSGFLPARVVHVHPTRACNLACAHCYSESSPTAREQLAVEPLLDALAALREQGYEIVSISGGEPLVYRPLPALVAGAAALGYRVHMITNGLRLTNARLDELAPHLFLIGVSLDGNEATHNAVRGRPDAFRGALRALRLLATRELPFGIIYAVTTPSLGDVPWAFSLAQELGARLLHLRPLAAEGRARTMASSWSLSPADCERLFLLAELLGAYGPGAPRVQVDLVHLDALEAARGQFALLDPAHPPRSLSDAVNPLIIDADGSCYPFSYGIEPSLRIATVADGVAADAFRLDGLLMERLATLLDATFASLASGPESCVDWFAHLTRMSRETVHAAR